MLDPVLEKAIDTAVANFKFRLSFEQKIKSVQGELSCFVSCQAGAHLKLYIPINYVRSDDE